MKRINIYSNSILYKIKGISLFAIVILVICLIGIFTENEILLVENSVQLYYTLAIDCIAIVLSLLLFCFPHKLGLISIISFMYSSYIFVYEPDNQMGILMFILAYVILCVRGFYLKHGEIKRICSVLVYIALICSECRFGLYKFLDYLGFKAGYTFVCTVILFFYKIYFNKKEGFPKVINLYNYEHLTKRDAIWLCKLQKNINYDSIAKEEGITVGEVKSRFKYIFSVLEVGDKMGFFSRYSDYMIDYAEEKGPNSDYLFF